MRIRTSLIGLAVVAAGVAAMAVPGPASAVMCGDRPPLDQVIAKADAAFVGVVERVANEDRWAQVRVEDIWGGAVATPSVEVRGGHEPGVWSSADRTYVGGERYLFVVGVRGGHFVDNYCSATQPWEPALMRFRPLGAVLASDVGVEGRTPDPDVASVILPGLAVVTIGIAVFGLVIAFRSNR
jgi:hypothetical protein